MVRGGDVETRNYAPCLWKSWDLTALTLVQCMGHQSKSQSIKILNYFVDLTVSILVTSLLLLKDTMTKVIYKRKPLTWGSWFLMGVEFMTFMMGNMAAVGQARHGRNN